MNKYLLPVFILAVIPLAVLLHFYFSGNWYSLFHSYSLGIAFGLTAWVLFLSTLVLSSRISLLERILGQDRLIVLHRFTGTAAVLSGLLHIYFKLRFSAEISPQLISGSMIGLVVLPLSALSLLIMSRSFFDRFKPFYALKKRVRRAVRYSAMKFLHNGLALVLSLVLIHILIAPSTAETGIRSLLIILTGIPVLALWIFHRFIRPVFYLKGKIKDINHFTPELFSLSLDFDDGHSIIPGQFCYFRFSVPGAPGEEHPFTLSGIPGPGQAELLIKKEGAWTRAVSELKPGSPLSLSRPYGRFILSSPGPMLWVAGGVGITPFLSRIRFLKTGGSMLKSRVVLAWTARTLTDMPYKNEIEDYAGLESNFRFIPVLTREPSIPARISSDFIEACLNELSAKSPSLWYCGPLSLRREVFQGAGKAGIPRRNIHWEEFSLN